MRLYHDAGEFPPEEVPVIPVTVKNTFIHLLPSPEPLCPAAKTLQRSKTDPTPQPPSPPPDLDSSAGTPGSPRSAKGESEPAATSDGNTVWTLGARSPSSRGREGAGEDTGPLFFSALQYCSSLLGEEK
mmetsp:Transcript_141265/g.393698  ORF Transcript_141265/g.393698 Transcript_141265/m.393698 type:complete len:129 (+) Transcript_141265:99-485(+)